MSHVCNRPVEKCPQGLPLLHAVPLGVALFFAVGWSSYNVMDDEHHMPEVERLAANLATFEKRIPRSELIGTIEPFLHEYPNDVTIWLADSWNNEPAITRRFLIEQWVKAWEETVRARPADNSPAHIWIKAPNGSYIETKVNKNRGLKERVGSALNQIP